MEVAAGGQLFAKPTPLSGYVWFTAVVLYHVFHLVGVLLRLLVLDAPLLDLAGQLVHREARVDTASVLQ